VNPYDVDSVAETMHTALLLPGPERRRRMHALRSQVLEHDVHRWANAFLSALDERTATPAISSRDEDATRR
jgi:trehalose-6-phosphate synthase